MVILKMQLSMQLGFYNQARQVTRARLQKTTQKGLLK